MQVSYRPPTIESSQRPGSAHPGCELVRVQGAIGSQTGDTAPLTEDSVRSLGSRAILCIEFSAGLSLRDKREAKKEAEQIRKTVRAPG